MPVIYPKAIRRKFASLNLDKVKAILVNEGYEFVRDGGFRPEDEPFKFSNYLFYDKKETNEHYRIGYNYPLFGDKNHIFEICYWKKCYEWACHNLIPDFRENFWREISDLYEKNENGNFIKKK